MRPLRINNASGQIFLSNLEVAEHTHAYVRCHDFWIGNSTRHGSPGRAIVDLGTTLHFNYDGDWNGGCRYYVSMERVSTREVKHDICSLSDSAATKIIKGLTPVTFRYKNTNCSRQYLGFIAEEVPDEIAASDRQAVNTDHIVAALTKVVQDQQRLVETLDRRILALELSR